MLKLLSQGFTLPFRLGCSTSYFFARAPPKSTPQPKAPVSGAKKTEAEVSAADATSIRKGVPRRLLDRQPRREKIFTLADKNIHYNPFQALKLMRLHSFVSFPESVDFLVKLNVNPKNGDQIVRGTATMPSGLGKTTIVAVLCTSDEYKDLLATGAKPDLRVTDEMIKGIEKGVINFERLFTTPEHLPKIKHLGRMLGPKGLMPNIRVNTLVTIADLPKSIKEAKMGQVTFRVDNGRNLHAGLGKMAFTDEQLLANLRELMKALADRRPAGLKGKYFLEAFLKSTMGPRWRLNLTDIDPRQPNSIWPLLEAEEQVTSAERS